MFSRFPIASICALSVLAASLTGSAAVAHHIEKKSAAIIIVGGKDVGIKLRSQHPVKRYYFVPKTKHSLKKHGVHPRKKIKKHHRSGLKRHKFGRYPHKSTRRHGRRSLGIKKKYHFRRY